MLESNAFIRNWTNFEYFSLLTGGDLILERRMEATLPKAP